MKSVVQGTVFFYCGIYNKVNFINVSWLSPVPQGWEIQFKAIATSSPDNINHLSITIYVLAFVV